MGKKYKHKTAEARSSEKKRAIQSKSFTPPDSGINFTVQKKENKTGMPDNLKSGLESMSGLDLSDVKVHYNSSQPAQLNAHAFAQGNQIHVAPGQEKHLPHEGWHVVQQKQGRVKPTKQLKSSVAVNDDPALEKEADVMGAKALQKRTLTNTSKNNKKTGSTTGTAQRKISVEGELYPDNATKREFRRQLMLALKKYDFKELGTKKMWAKIDEWLDKAGTEVFVDWEALTNKLWDEGTLTRNQKFASMGPKNLGDRPDFLKKTKDTLEVGVGQHRRHIISSSTLGKGIEGGYEILKQVYAGQPAKILEDLNVWISGNGGSKKASEYLALREIWSLVHNHLGNLWIGEGKYNSAIGFIRAPLTTLLKELHGKDFVKTEDVITRIKAIKPPMSFLKQAWVDIVKTLEDSVEMANPVISDISLIGAYINWQNEMDKLENTEFYKPAMKIYDMLHDSLFSRNRRVSVTSAIQRLNMIVNANYKFSSEKQNLPVYEKWIIRYGLPNEYIHASTASQLIEEWIRNCDLDFPYALVEKGKKEYFTKLFTIYAHVLVPGPNFFKQGGVLDHFMRLSFK